MNTRSFRIDDETEAALAKLPNRRKSFLIRRAIQLLAHLDDTLGGKAASTEVRVRIFNDTHGVNMEVMQ
jgi:hypothetical protein